MKLFKIFSLCFILMSCAQNEQNINSKNENNQLEYKNVNLASRIDTLNFSNWQQYEIGTDDIYIPKDWRVVDQKEINFFSYINNDSNSYFAIAKFDIKRDNINYKLYLNTLYNQALQDSVEKFIGYTIKKLYLDNQTLYLGEYFTNLGGKEYVLISMVVERDFHLYDFAIKVPKEDYQYFHKIFQLILFLFRKDNHTIFDEHEEIEKEEIIEFPILN